MVKLVKWVNLSDKSIRFVKGLAGVPWPGCDSEPGGIVEAPDSPGYTRHCEAAGYTRFTPDMQRAIDEETQLKAMIAEDEAKKASEVVESEAPAIIPPTESVPETSPQESEQAPKGINSRGRSNRSPKG